jgi:hypothetical protein
MRKTTAYQVSVTKSDCGDPASNTIHSLYSVPVVSKCIVVVFTNCCIYMGIQDNGIEFRSSDYDVLSGHNQNASLMA